jgi:hypothetical protein
VESKPGGGSDAKPNADGSKTSFAFNILGKVIRRVVSSQSGRAGTESQINR